MPDKHKPKDPVAHHLEFLGYDCRATPDGWTYAEHPKRPNLFYRKFAYGWRLHAAFYLGRTLRDLRPSFLEGLNALNDRSMAVRFSLHRDSDGDYAIRARAYFTGDYRRKDFGAFMDVWHSDLELLSELPRIPDEAEAPDADENAAAELARVVN